ncbi:MAG TPA: plastocyanin/azurin family copper-binding protein [Chryseolinea sp.]|nr:plastocyanin/azurin family copper-binding protein [Chryseolinea sp.]
MVRLKIFSICCWLLVVMLQCSPSGKKDGAADENEIADPQQPQQQVVHTIEIKQMKFSPDTLNVRKGDKVIWVNADIVEHDVTQLSKKAWASSKLATGASWSMIVTKSEDYYCNLHVVMRGKLIVEGDNASNVVESSLIPICR